MSKPVHIGCSGWNYRDWRGVIYPEDLPARRWLEHYAELFDTVEVNATFYRLPTRKAVAADPRNTQALFDLAYRLDLSGEEDEAVDLYERCCDTTPATMNTLVNLAVMYEDRGDYARAERCLRLTADEAIAKACSCLSGLKCCLRLVHGNLSGGKLGACLIGKKVVGILHEEISEELSTFLALARARFIAGEVKQREGSALRVS